jgi:hypothetical protein
LLLRKSLLTPVHIMASLKTGLTAWPAKTLSPALIASHAGLVSHLTGISLCSLVASQASLLTPLTKIFSCILHLATASISLTSLGTAS